MSIYVSLFDKRAASIGAALESLAGKNARSALGMFADIIASPHVPTNQVGSTAAAAPVARIDEDGSVRALMRGRYSPFNNSLQYVRNILSPAPNSMRPSNFLYADILEFLIRNRKVKIDFSVEGYASARTIVNRMGQLGYDEGDAFSGLAQLSKSFFRTVETSLSLMLEAIPEPGAAPNIASCGDGRRVPTWDSRNNKYRTAQREDLEHSAASTRFFGLPPTAGEHRLEERAGVAALLARHVFGRAGGDDFAVAAFGAEVDDPVGGAPITSPPPASVRTPAVFGRFRNVAAAECKTSRFEFFGIIERHCRGPAFVAVVKLIGTSAAYLPSWISSVILRVLPIILTSASGPHSRAPHGAAPPKGPGNLLRRLDALVRKPDLAVAPPSNITLGVQLPAGDQQPHARIECFRCCDGDLNAAPFERLISLCRNPRDLPPLLIAEGYEQVVEF